MNFTKGTRFWIRTGLWTVLGLMGTPVVATAETGSRPNIVHIFADDMGWGSVGAYGSTTIATPNLDALAAAGMKFERAYAATVCAPSRAMLLTGFHNGHTFLDRNANIGQGFREQDGSVAETMTEAGYLTAIVGKWGFGGGGGQGGSLRANPSVQVPETLPQNQGYQYFYGYLNHGRAHSYGVDSLWTTEEPPEDLKYREQPDNGLWLESTGNTSEEPFAAYTMDIIARKAEAFIIDQVGSEEPFYLQLNHLVPHFDVDAIAETGPLYDLDGNIIAPAGLGIYADADLSDKERKHAAMVTRMDASIGALMRRLEDPFGEGNSDQSLLNNTIVIFTSDNGPSPEDGVGLQGILNLDATGGLRGGKRDLWEGGIRVPLIVRWDGRIDPGSTSDFPTDLADFFPTVADLAGVRGPVGMDGVSILPTLTGQGVQRDREFLVFEHHEWAGPGPDTEDRRARWAVIRGDQKLIRFDDDSRELYDLANDRGEVQPLDLTLHGPLVDELQSAALAEGVEQPDGYGVEYVEWTGVDGAVLDEPENWSIEAAPASIWSAPVVNRGSADAVGHVRGNLELLGFEVRGETALQTVIVEQTAVLEGRNEVRVANRGRLHLESSTLRSNRWIDLWDGGALTGQGQIEGPLNNAGLVAPGRPADLPDPPAPKTGVTTGVVDAIVFDFVGQDDAPMTNTETIDENLELIRGFDFGPGVSPRNAADAGDEFNVMGHNSPTLADTIDNGNYLTFTIAPVPGVAIKIETISVNLWRNGPAAANDFAILTSQRGFTADEALGTLNNITDAGESNSHLFVVQDSGVEPTTQAVEVRVYGWNANGEHGNTHFNGASVTASFVSTPTESFGLSGVLTVGDTYTQKPEGVLRIGIAGADGAEHDLLRVGGDLFLDGLLEVEATEDYVAKAGDAFQVLEWNGTLSGEFSGIYAFELEPELRWNMEGLYSEGVIRVEAAQGGFETAVMEAGLSGEDARPDASPFGDGVTNLVKYAFNLDLARSDRRYLTVDGDETAGLPKVYLKEEGDGGPFLVVEYLRRRNDELSYAAKFSTDLDSASFEAATADPQVIEIDAEWERVIVEEPIDPADTRHFGRVEVDERGTE